MVPGLALQCKAATVVNDVAVTEVSGVAFGHLGAGCTVLASTTFCTTLGVIRCTWLSLAVQLKRVALKQKPLTLSDLESQGQP